jgi:hypothetical protein
MLDALSSAALTVKRMPAQVFRSQYDRFRFLEFDRFPNPEFLALLRRLMEASRDSKTNLVVLEPDPETYFYKNSAILGPSKSELTNRGIVIARKWRAARRHLPPTLLP